MGYRPLLFAIAIAAPGAAAGQGNAPLQTFESNGVRIRYVDRGQGPAVLLVHGFSANVELNWGVNGILDSLAKTYRVVALDLRGHGRSGKPHESTAYGAQHVQDLVNLLDHLRIDRAHIVGYSLGAAITTKLLVTHPGRVMSAVLGGGGGIIEGGEVPEQIVVWRTRLEQAARDGTPVYDAMRMPDFPDFPPEIIAMVNQNDAAALAASLRGDDGLRITQAELQGLKMPVTMVLGAADSLALPDVDLMRSLVPGLRVRLLPGLDHLTTVNHPVFQQAVAESLRDGTSRPPGTRSQQQR